MARCEPRAGAAEFSKRGFRSLRWRSHFAARDSVSKPRHARHARVSAAHRRCVLPDWRPAETRRRQSGRATCTRVTAQPARNVALSGGTAAPHRPESGTRGRPPRRSSSSAFACAKRVRRAEQVDRGRGHRLRCQQHPLCASGVLPCATTATGGVRVLACIALRGRRDPAHVADVGRSADRAALAGPRTDRSRRTTPSDRATPGSANATTFRYPEQ